jgi:SAM-dependent methyltransferase
MIKNSLRNVKLVDRVDYICKKCDSKKVLHLGATDSPYTEDAIRENRFLHFYLQGVTDELTGIDLDEKMIAYLSVNHDINNIQLGNIEVIDDYPKSIFDVIVAGEILEHLSNPGNAIQSIAKAATTKTKIIITVPNAYSFKGFCRALLGFEVIHSDHVLHHSLYTLTQLLHRYDLKIVEEFSFVNGGDGLAAKTANLLLRLVPWLAEGIGVICIKDDQN